MKLVFATNNAHKLEEARQILLPFVEVISLNDAGFFEDIEETGLTLEANASIKATTIFAATGLDCFADDTGLEIEALDGRPGVYSARYAGPGHDFSANVDKVLEELQNESNRCARFRTAVSLILDGKEFFFEGIVEGSIMFERAGTGGFGYDPVFRPDGFLKSFAELNSDEKNAISHRGRALAKMVDFLKTLNS
ncbi:MAG: non-canonical purine NTP pyrophosphatase, RdgB/HAM1 family [Bacteroidetes bacterium GWF2_43_63]|nr:MAG: non-canonical purine NTP pyrophosphatase, RdgB/HAM1 family [Bacteroidetes bacterium GWE2_42_42]OFY55694.1 MAG: non-canonical purine NTP pyrophosphatase, RdgB/HAM1 family [Bacteroidetes bacterium GWF2_43_63]HBG69499.1 non-canonical purine NTP pyrophosphatase, RdgB/HAM1 family [Bacteroidales bacterium]HCB61334.1 non-canonical purine NTP pyrophosphatase, RdgB/HAM1 family [Bacteroidales bacterium]HCY24209.1 non-canonical purine NTP pyrophosphatase, RdgB/HAM1 family [Bacteroidales bacterium]